MGRRDSLGAVAEGERDVIRERTMAGLEAARVRGRKSGRKPVVDDRKIVLASKLMCDRETPISEVCSAVASQGRRSTGNLKPD
jgi:DNA invertase Pin-like site-specific DNA recombinase